MAHHSPLPPGRLDVQIIGVVDVSDALRTTGRYRAAMPHHEAFLPAIGAGDGGQVEDHGVQAAPLRLSL